VIETKPKNRRASGAKFSEYRLKNLVLCFAQNMTVKDTAKKTRFSEATVRNHFMRIRQRIYDHGFMRVNRREGANMPARIIFAKKHRGVPEKYSHLYEAEFLHRVFSTKNAQAVIRFSAAKDSDIKALRKYVNYNKINDKYDIIEMLESGGSGQHSTTRPFDPVDFKSSSTIIVNERNIDPHDAFFRFIWALLLKYPL